jgi:hypothetical protein
MPSAGMSSGGGTGGKGGGGGTGGSGASGGSAGANAGSTAMGSGGTSAGSGGSGQSAAGTTASGGMRSMAGAGGGGATAGAASGGAPGGGMGGSATGGGGASSGGKAGGATAGSGGAATGGMAGGGGSSTANFTCNQVIGLDSTGEWYTAGFEQQVNDDKWQIIYHHPGYVETWGDPSSEDWDRTKAPITSPCKMNSDNPDRVIFNMFPDTSDTSSTALKDKASWMTGIQKVITTLKSKYSNLKRVDLLTMTRAPNNVACDSTNAIGSMVDQATDDAVAALVSSGPPAIVASPKFYAPSCDDFMSGGPHFTDAAKPIIAKIYGDYYSAEP